MSSGGGTACRHRATGPCSCSGSGGKIVVHTHEQQCPRPDFLCAVGTAWAAPHRFRTGQHDHRRRTGRRYQRVNTRHLLGSCCRVRDVSWDPATPVRDPPPAHPVHAPCTQWQSRARWPHTLIKGSSTVIGTFCETRAVVGGRSRGRVHAGLRAGTIRCRARRRVQPSMQGG